MIRYCRSTISGYESNSLGCLKLIKALYEHPAAAIGDVVQPQGRIGDCFTMYRPRVKLTMTLSYGSNEL